MAISVGALFVTAAIGPLVIERAGVLGQTMSVDGAGILLHAPAVGPAEGPALPVGALYATGSSSAPARWHTRCARARAAHRHLHRQAWQLRQLVPRSCRSMSTTCS